MMQENIASFEVIIDKNEREKTTSKIIYLPSFRMNDTSKLGNFMQLCLNKP